MFGKHFGSKKQRLREKRCFNVPNIVPTFVPIRNYCPIIFVKGEADRDYRTRGDFGVIYDIVLYTIWYSIMYCMA
jgi:hypothetical protein